MKISNRQYAQGLFSAIDGQDEAAIIKALGNFIRLLSANGDVGRSEAIILEFEKFWQKAKSVVFGRLVSAKELPSQTLGEIESYVKQKTGVKEVYLESQLNHSLLSGFILSYGDRVVDSSAKSMIIKLKNELIK
jgi:F-type H+-transporting ATPase subunit delta